MIYFLVTAIQPPPPSIKNQPQCGPLGNHQTQSLCIRIQDTTPPIAPLDRGQWYFTQQLRGESQVIVTRTQ